jgi:hypothetical protein
VAVDGKEKKKPEKLPVSSKKPEDADSAHEEEEATSGEEDAGDPDYVEESHTESDGGSTTEEDFPEDEETTKNVSAVIRKTGKKEVKSNKKNLKRKASQAAPKRAKQSKKVKQEKEHDKVEVSVNLDEWEEGEKKELAHPDVEAEKGKDLADKKGVKAKRVLPTYNDKNVDYDLFNSAAANLNQRRVRLNNNILLTCKMIDEIDGKSISYEYAALTFQRKMANGRMFEFMLPFSIAKKIVKGIELLIKENEKFFDKD